MINLPFDAYSSSEKDLDSLLGHLESNNFPLDLKIKISAKHEGFKSIGVKDLQMKGWTLVSRQAYMETWGKKIFV